MTCVVRKKGRTVAEGHKACAFKAANDFWRAREAVKPRATCAKRALALRAMTSAERRMLRHLEALGKGKRGAKVPKALLLSYYKVEASRRKAQADVGAACSVRPARKKRT